MAAVERSYGPALPRRDRGGSAGVRAELVALRGRKLGACSACGQPVYLAHNFTRVRGRVMHVRCPINTAPSALAPSAVAPAPGGAKRL
jgi:hypothetical protein